MQPTSKPDYEKLRRILERELDREVSLEYALNAGDFLISVYETLLYGEETTDQIDGKLVTDTTNR